MCSSLADAVTSNPTVKSFGAEKLGQQTLDRLEEHLVADADRRQVLRQVEVFVVGVVQGRVAGADRIGEREAALRAALDRLARRLRLGEHPGRREGVLDARDDRVDRSAVGVLLVHGGAPDDALLDRPPGAADRPGTSKPGPPPTRIPGL